MRFNKLISASAAIGVAGAILAGGAASAQAATTNAVFQGPVVFDGNGNLDFIYTLLGAGDAGYPAYATSNKTVPTKWAVPMIGTTGTISQGNTCLERQGDSDGADIVYAACSGKALQKFKTVKNGSWTYFSIPGVTGAGIGLASGYLGNNALEVQTTNIPEGVNYSLFSDVAEQSVAITGPTNGSTVTTKRPTMTGSGEPGATITVTTQTGITLGTTTVKADGTWTLPAQNDIVTPTPTITATQTIPGGPTTTTTVTFTITISANLTGKIDSVDAANRTATLSGTGTAGDTITITGPNGAQTALIGADGTWTANVPGLADGDNAITIADGSDTVTLTATILPSPIVNPLVAGGAGVLSLLAFGSTMIIRRRVKA